MINNIEGIQQLQTLEIQQKKKSEKFINFLEERKEYLKDIREFYRFHAFSVDFGDQPIELEYTTGRYMKCADSDGKIYFERTIPEDISCKDLVDIIDKLFAEEPLSSLLEILEFSDWRDLSYLASFDKRRLEDRPPRNLREFLRECLEWSVLLDYARKNRRLILLKDGLLRNKIFKRIADDPTCAYRKLQEQVEKICHNNENLIIGIAKSSKLLRQVNKFLEKTYTFKSQKPFVIQIENDHEIMQISYTYDLYREGEVVFGDHLHITRFKASVSADIFTIEIPSFAETNWDGIPAGRKNEFIDKSYTYIVGLIAGLPQRTLPSRFNGAPEPLAKAHEYAHTKKIVAKGIERKIRQNIKLEDLDNA
ncbi:MAG: hypothetical protein HEP80_22020 [Dolichospermum sp. UKL201]|jgi:hypothetical protein|nr:MAG: hypothetical protein HEP80_22020 [Dolichospermum sp. UKL201]